LAIAFCVGPCVPLGVVGGDGPEPGEPEGKRDVVARWKWDKSLVRFGHAQYLTT